MTTFIYSLSYLYVLSKLINAKPPLKLPAILLNELDTPLTVFYTKLPAPFAIPIPPSIGPFIKPSIGLSNKS